MMMMVMKVMMMIAETNKQTKQQQTNKKVNNKDALVDKHKHQATCLSPFLHKVSQLDRLVCKAIQC